MHRRHGPIKRALIALRRLVRDQRGATAVEYGLILALVFLAMIAAVQGVADETIGMWDYVSNRVVNAE
ncbi:Flp family type IVb pilin [Sphingomonas jeddahensis]|nr:Flp family type IVb pilin [Sphingomonas jeddahensis]